MESGEDPKTAIIRELNEELELVAEPVYFGTYVEDDADFFCFVMTTALSREQLLAQQHEGDDLAFFSLDELPVSQLRKTHVTILTDITKAMHEGRLRL